MKRNIPTRTERGYMIRHDDDRPAPYIYNLSDNMIDGGGDYRWFNFYGLRCKVHPALNLKSFIIGD